MTTPDLIRGLFLGILNAKNSKGVVANDRGLVNDA